MITCEVCGATCTDAKDLNRFRRRHPSKCKERQTRQEFSKQLAEGAKSVDGEYKIINGRIVRK